MRRACTLALMLTAVSSAASAQQSVTLDRFRASETPDDDFHVSRPTDLGHLRWGAQIHLDYANDPLVYEQQFGDRESESARIVSNQLVGTLGLSLGLWDRLVVYAGLPVNFVQNGDDAAELQAAGLDVSDGAGLGDAYLGARVRLFGEREDMFALAVQASLTLPTAGDQLFRGDEFLSFHPEAVFELRLAPVRFVGNVGVRVRENIEGGLRREHSDEFTFALGFVTPLYENEDPRTHVDLHAQVYGASMFHDFFGRAGSPMEATAGLKFFHRSGIIAGVAMGGGIQRGYGSPDVRVVGMLGYRPSPERCEVDPDHCAEPEPQPEPEPTPEDADGDGILDAEDACPTEAEDVDTFQDEDGCPDLDDDEDGIPDTEDECRMEPEDIDTFEDENGCPDPDNDGDGVADTADRCPLEAGPASNNGCPDPDRDGDGVPDRLDNCPDEAGPRENQGCEEEQQVIIQEGRLEILDKVYFRTNRAAIQRRSNALLQNVAQVLNAHPEITMIHVEGHTDSRGGHDYNVRLSQQRAEAVVAYLVRQGVDAGRLEAHGYGPDRPIEADASTPEQHAANRRVEFNIPGSDLQTREGGPQADTIDR